MSADELQIKTPFIIFLMLVSSAICACASSGESDADGDPEIDGDISSTDGDTEVEPDGTDGDSVDAEVEAESGLDAACLVNADDIDGGTVSIFKHNEVTFDEDLFAIGVQAGSMTDSEVILWTHTEDNLPKQLRIWRMGSDGEEIILVQDLPVIPAEGYIKENVDSLAPGTVYYYAFFHEEYGALVKRSMIGRFRTAIAEGCKAPITIGGTHGTNKHVGLPYTALEISARYELDAFVHLGDRAYNYGASDVESYRKEWRRSLVSPMMQVSMAATGHYIVWDDHELTDNSNLYTLPPEHLAAGKQVFFEHTPVPLHANGSYWRSYRWGDSVEFFSLDSRHERIDPSCALKPGSDEYDENVYIGAEQMAWLKEGLANSTAHFKVIFNSVPITKFPDVWNIALCDRWEGYPDQREEILDHIADEEIDNVWWLTGDFHCGTVNRIELEGARRQMWEIMMGPGGNKNNPFWALYAEGLYDPEAIAPIEQFRFFGGNYMTTLLTFDPQKDAGRITFIDAESEETLYDEWIREGD